VNQDEDRGHRASDPARVRVLQGQLNAPAPPAGAAGGARLSLRPSVEPFVTGSGDLYLLRAGEPDLLIRDADPTDRALVDAIAEAPWSRARLAGQLGLSPAQLESKLAALAAAGVLVEHVSPAPPLEPDEARRFSRQLPYLAETGDPSALQRRLRASTVVVVGCGGLGTWALAALASAGVGRFVLVDDDVVERSNLNRQILYGEADVGEAKVDAAARWIAGFDHRIEVVPVQRRIAAAADVPAVVEGADVVVVAADWPAYLLARWINAACVAGRIPFVLAGQVPPILKVGPIYWPGRTACFACHEDALRRASPHYDDYVAHAQAAPQRSATLGPASGLVGAALGIDLLHLLTGRRPASLGAAVLLDMRTLAARREELERARGCAACQHLG
jgi:bacteriocin biosynthesis cyclodehydratase domain-containing protein